MKKIIISNEVLNLLINSTIDKFNSKGLRNPLDRNHIKTTDLVGKSNSHPDNNPEEVTVGGDIQKFLKLNQITFGLKLFYQDFFSQASKKESHTLSHKKIAALLFYIHTEKTTLQDFLISHKEKGNISTEEYKTQLNLLETKEYNGPKMFFSLFYKNGNGERRRASVCLGHGNDISFSYKNYSTIVGKEVRYSGNYTFCKQTEEHGKIYFDLKRLGNNDKVLHCSRSHIMFNSKLDLRQIQFNTFVEGIAIFETHDGRTVSTKVLLQADEIERTENTPSLDSIDLETVKHLGSLNNRIEVHPTKKNEYNEELSERFAEIRGVYESFSLNSEGKGINKYYYYIDSYGFACFKGIDGGSYTGNVEILGKKKRTIKIRLKNECNRFTYLGKIEGNGRGNITIKGMFLGAFNSKEKVEGADEILFQMKDRRVGEEELKNMEQSHEYFLSDTKYSSYLIQDLSRKEYDKELFSKHPGLKSFFTGESGLSAKRNLLKKLEFTHNDTEIQDEIVGYYNVYLQSSIDTIIRKYILQIRDDGTAVVNGKDRFNLGFWYIQGNGILDIRFRKSSTNHGNNDEFLGQMLLYVGNGGNGKLKRLTGILSGLGDLFDGGSEDQLLNGANYAPVPAATKCIVVEMKKELSEEYQKNLGYLVNSYNLNEFKEGIDSTNLIFNGGTIEYEKLFYSILGKTNNYISSERKVNFDMEDMIPNHSFSSTYFESACYLDILHNENKRNEITSDMLSKIAKIIEVVERFRNDKSLGGGEKSTLGILIEMLGENENLEKYFKNVSPRLREDFFELQNHIRSIDLESCSIDSAYDAISSLSELVSNGYDKHIEVLDDIGRQLSRAFSHAFGLFSTSELSCSLQSKDYRFQLRKLLETLNDENHSTYFREELIYEKFVKKINHLSNRIQLVITKGGVKRFKFKENTSHQLSGNKFQVQPSTMP